MKFRDQLIAIAGIVIMISLSACEKKADDNEPEKTYTETFIKSFGGDNTDAATVVWQASDGGYILAGSAMSDKSGDVGPNKGGYDVFIVKTDAYGNKLWQKNYGGTEGEAPVAIAGTADGGIVIAAGSYSNNSGDIGVNHGEQDIWVFKVDANGNLVWQKMLGGAGTEYASDIKSTTDGGFLVLGTSSSYMSGDVTTSHGPGGSDAWVVKLDANGKLLWQKSYGGIGIDNGNTIIVTADGGFLMAGGAGSHDNGDVGPNKGYIDLWVVKADPNGNLQWHKSYGGTDSEIAKGVVQTADGGYVITGETRSNNNGDVGANHGETDIWVLKLNTSGNLQWQKVIGGSKGDETFGIVKSSDGGFIIAGNTYNSNNGDVGASKGDLNIWLVKLSANGIIAGQDLLGLDNNRYEGVGNVGYASDIIGVSGSYLVLAASGISPRPEFGTEPDMYMVKTKEP